MSSERSEASRIDFGEMTQDVSVLSREALASVGTLPRVAASLLAIYALRFLQLLSDFGLFATDVA